jgi:alpha-2-macroglobulin
MMRPALTSIPRALLGLAGAALLAAGLWSGAAQAASVTDMEVLTDRDAPQLCYQFDSPVALGPTVDARLYVRALPDDISSVQAEGDRLCVEGLKHGGHYTVELLPQLPLRDGRLPVGRTDKVQIDDRPPTLSFRGDAYVLPRIGSAAVPLSAVNVARARLEVLRIGDRNLAANITRDIMDGGVASWDVDQIADTDGELVWKGSIDTAGTANVTNIVGVPIHQILPAPAPGLYLLLARHDDERSWSLARQWMVITDLGVALYQAEDGLLAAVRSLDSGQAVADAHITLLARNNTVLSEQTTGADGTVRFAPGLIHGTGGNRPELVLAQSAAGDFTLMRLSGPAFDLSDRGVGGREHPGPVEAFVTTERGIYRPGETIHALALLRDRAGNAATGLPLTLILRRPDGIEVNRWTQPADLAGAQTLDVPLSASSRTGEWTLTAYLDPNGPALGQTSVQVEDFVPLTMEVAATSTATLLKPGEDVAVDIGATYFYGAPAADLGGEVRPSLRVAATPYADWADFQFGLQDEEMPAQQLDTVPFTTDAAGKSAVTLALADDQLPDVGRPLEIAATISVFDIGGRPVNTTLSVPVADGRPAIGVRGPKTTLPINGEARFEIVAVDDAGQRTSLAGLEYRWVYEDVDYIWYRDGGGDWNYRMSVRDRPRASGTLDIGTAELASLALPVEWGRYRLDVFDPKSGAASSLRVRAGWSGSADADRPDQLSVSLDKPAYAVGDTATLFIDPPFAGPALLVVANERVHRVIEVTVAKGGTSVQIPVEQSWGPGTYVLATAFRPAATDQPGAKGPGRAVGVAWLGIDRSAQQLAITLTAPPEIRPYADLIVKANLSGPVDAQTYVRLAAVDEGVLRLTNFRTPDPHAVLFGKRRLLLEMRDLYGRLIQTHDSAGAVRSGGDSDQFAGLPADIVKTVALVSEPVKVNADGTAEFRLAIPDFQGSLRLMAIAWSATGVGASETPVIVRDPLVARLQLPRFLAPGDTAETALALDNVTGPTGTYRITLSAEGAASITGLLKSAPITLAAGEHRSLPLRLFGERVGTAALTLSIDGPEGLRIDRDWQIAVRAAQPLTTESVATLLQPGQSLTIGAETLAGTVPGSAKITLGLSSRPKLDVAGLLDDLDRYPYGCAEQTTSTALPLLYMADVAEAWHQQGETPLAADLRIEQAIARLMTMQDSDGLFGLWNASDGEPWLSAYVLDFLTRAQAANHSVPQRSLQKGLEALETHIKQAQTRQQCGADAAYALYVLSRAGVSDVAELRYYAEACAGRWPTTLAAAQIGTALSRIGDTTRANAAFSAAQSGRAVTAKTSRGRDLGDYGSPVRDQAALVALMDEAQRPLAEVLDEAATLPGLVEQRQWLSTQDQSWLLLAANALSDVPDTISATLDGQAVDAGDRVLGPNSLPHTIVNTGTGPVRARVSTRAVHTQSLPAQENGLSLTRRWLALDGTEVDPLQLVQNQLVLVELTGGYTDSQKRQLMIVDLLPAGLEIENTALQNASALADMVNPADLTATTHTESRDDRFVAAMDLGGKDTHFRIVYLARVVTPGDFALPPALAEDMYEPAINGRTDMGRVHVAAAR